MNTQPWKELYIIEALGFHNEMVDYTGMHQMHSLSLYVGFIN